MVSETEESVSKWEWLAVMNNTKRASKNNEKVLLDLHGDGSFSSLGEKKPEGKVT